MKFLSSTDGYNGSNASTIYLTTASPSLFSLGSYKEKLFVGMALALGGNLLISVSLSIQKKAHNRLGQDNNHSEYCCDKWWWIGMVLMCIGEIGNFMAYGFAAASLVAPLGSIAVISNIVIAALFLREPLTLPSMMGVSLVVVGAVTLINFSPINKPVLTSSQIVIYLQAWPFLLYISLEALLLAILLYVKYMKKNEHMVVLLLLVAVIASVTIIAAKALSTLLSESILQGKDHILNPVFWVSLIILPVTTITQIRFLNRAMQLYDVSDVVPVNFIFFTLSAILAGAMFYQEFYGVYFDRIFMFTFGCLESFIGVAIITQQKEYKNGNGVAMNNRGDNDKEDPCCFRFFPESQIDRDARENERNSSVSSTPTRGTSFLLFNSLGDSSGLCNQSSSNVRKPPQNQRDFFGDFIKSVKSTESLSEIQPLLENSEKTTR